MDVGYLGCFLAFSFAERREGFTATLNHSIMHSTAQENEEGVLDFLPLILLAAIKALSVLLGSISPVLSSATLE